MATGEAVYASIRREACPLLRMRSHDLMEVFTDPCPAADHLPLPHPGPFGRHVHRQGRQRVSAGDPAVLMALAPRATGEFQVVLDQRPLD